MKRWLTDIFDRSGLLAVASGILVALSFPGGNLSFLAWVALIPLLTALEGVSLSVAFRIGFTCGVTAYCGILYWINNVITDYGHLPWAVSIVLYLALASWLALFYGLSTLTARLGEQAGIKSAFALPAAWVAGDFVRSWALTGIPWAMLGHSQYRVLPVIQIADLFGVYGITLLIVLCNVVLYRALRAVTGAMVPYPVKSAVIFLALFSGVLWYGFTRLNESQSSGTPLRVAVIQGNIPQNVKWSPQFQDATLDIYERLTREAARSGIDLAVWPESAVPFFLQDDGVRAARIRTIAADTGASLIVGSPAHELRGGERVFLNSAFLITPGGGIAGRSDKLHLVPFGEYVPLKRLLPFVSKLVAGIGDFAPGERAVTLPVGTTMVGTMICAEAIFPETGRAYGAGGARVLANITNDAWFGRSSAPHQHLAISVFRAVETRTPMVRAANTGVSAIIDRNGHISSMTGIFTEGFRVGDVRPGKGASPYLAAGDAFAWLCLVVTAAVILRAYGRHRDAGSA